MQNISPGSLIAIKQDNKYYYYLVLTKSVLFGSQWCYVFHFTSSEQNDSQNVLNTFGNGFHALVDFIEERRNNQIIKIQNEIETIKYDFNSNLKARIDDNKGSYLWYIYSKKFEIIDKKNRLEESECYFPIASGMKCKQSVILIEKRWKIENVVHFGEKGQFPFE